MGCGLFKALGNLFGGAPKQEPFILPTPKIPAPPAPVRRQDTGANVLIGSDSVKGRRVSGGGRGGGSGRGGRDSIGSLGRGSGINI